MHTDKRHGIHPYGHSRTFLTAEPSLIPRSHTLIISHIEPTRYFRSHSPPHVHGSTALYSPFTLIRLSCIHFHTLTHSDPQGPPLAPSRGKEFPSSLSFCYLLTLFPPYYTYPMSHPFSLITFIIPPHPLLHERIQALLPPFSSFLSAKYRHLTITLQEPIPAPPHLLFLFRLLFRLLLLPLNVFVHDTTKDLPSRYPLPRMVAVVDNEFRPLLA